MAQHSAGTPSRSRRTAGNLLHGGVSRHLAGIFMIVFLSAGFLLAMLNPATFRSPAASPLDGSWAERYQEEFDAASPLLEPSLAVWGVLRFALFGEGQDGVLVGEEGWLFTTEEFEWPHDARERLERNLDVVEQVGERLAEHGAELVVALVPAKARIHPERLGRYRLPENTVERYREAMTGLEARGVTAVDLRPALERVAEDGAAFLRTDTHWTPRGAEAAARAVAEAVRARSPFAGLGETEFVTREGTTESHRGDLLNFIHLGPLHDSLAPEDDLLTRHETVAASPSGSLLGPTDIPVALVGTSYSADERWNFVGALRQALGADVLDAAESGRGPYAPMEDYLEGEALRSASPRVVVWEIPERHLTIEMADETVEDER